MASTQLFQFGIGNVGQAFIHQIKKHNQAHPEHVFQHLGVANSRSIAYAAEGLNLEALDWQKHPVDFLSLLPDMARSAQQLVLVDLTASKSLIPQLQQGVQLGCSLLLANKYPLVDQIDIFNQFITNPLGCSATVGSGLPLLPAIARLQEAGQTIIRVEACLSGTLGVLCDALEQGEAFSEIVREALEKGYTEPDPREDLAGNDVARKILIISRMMGHPNELTSVKIDKLYPMAMDALDIPGFLDGLRVLDPIYAGRFTQAADRGETLRYVASIDQETCSVKLRLAPKQSVIGQTRGSDKVCLIHTREQPEEPLVIHGGGAGAESTAADLLEDLKRISGMNG